MRRPKVYIASALFSDAERSTNEAMASILEKWCDVFLPQRDGYLLTTLIERGMGVNEAYSFVFKRDIAAISQCNAIIINLDGRTIDEGAAFELGYAYANSKLCVGYRTDVRVLLQWGLNPMITVPLERVLTSPAELDEWARFVATQGIGRGVRRPPHPA
jgi:nucleoside 2-deoxyribosyltransferase